LPAGDQPQAIKSLLSNFLSGKNHQVLLGVTGSGKTFTVANIIEKLNLPSLVISHNKTLAAQLYQEFKEFFPENAVEYFVSYYDYYQPESYIPQTDTYIEKEADINKEIDKLRLRATASLMSRRDVIVVSSVSCIYNLGSPDEYLKQSLRVDKGTITQDELIKKLTDIYYERSSFEFTRGQIRVVGENIDVWPAYENAPVRFEFKIEKIYGIYKFNSVTGEKAEDLASYVVFPAKHYLTEESKRDEALLQIESDLASQLKNLKSQKKPLEAYRLKQKTLNDIEMIREIGYCNGIENYSRYFDGRKSGSPPFTLFDFFKDEFLLVIDESHMTIPQIGGMFNGDRSRKQTLVDYGFRLPSCLDNRPLQFNEFEKRMPKTIYTSATPAVWEIDKSKNCIVEQLVRPTGIIDPRVTILPSKGQISDLMSRVADKVKKNERTLITTLTKKMAEELSEYLSTNTKFKVSYLHSDILTLERTDILDRLRRGEFDVLVGVNLLREGLDLPEVSLVVIFDADKEGFLRSRTSLVQTMGRAARNVTGEIVMYADQVTTSMSEAILEVDRRRAVQLAYNQKNNIVPKTIIRPYRENIVKIQDRIDDPEVVILPENFEFRTLKPSRQKEIVRNLERLMVEYAKNLEFEKAATVRDRIKALKI